MAASTSDSAPQPLISLIVLSGDAGLGPQLQGLAAGKPHQPVVIVPAATPDLALAALAAAGRNAVVLYDLRHHREAAHQLLSALPVLKRLAPIVVLLDDETAPIATAVIAGGAVEVVAFPDLTPALLGHVLRHALQLRVSEQRLLKLRLHEPVIGIPSQILFWEILSLAVRRAKRNRDFLAVLLIDLDNLPDGEGAEAPYRDLALSDLVGRIRPVLRGSDTIARLETQQLAILVESMPRVEDIQVVAEKIIEEVELPLSVGAGPVALEAAIGIALFPTSAETPEDMLARATDAMLQARERGRNRFAFA
jgi:diguanylate cyclase (GGDEF)-like protein